MPNMALVPLRVHVMQNLKDDMHYATVDEAEIVHGRLKQYFRVTIAEKDILYPGDYYLPIPTICPYSGHRCRGGGCYPCEYVPEC